MYFIVQHDEAEAEILLLPLALSLCSNAKIMLQTDDFFISWTQISNMAVPTKVCGYWDK